jgi:hypothetical protein
VKDQVFNHMEALMKFITKESCGAHCLGSIYAGKCNEPFCGF